MKENSARQAISHNRPARRLLIGSGLPILLLLAVFFGIFPSGRLGTPALLVPEISAPAATVQPTAPVTEPTVPLPETLVAVNGVILSAPRFDQILAMDTTLAALLGRESPTPRAALEQWINRTLLFQASPNTESVDPQSQLTALLAQYNLSEDDLTQALNAAGIDEPLFRTYFRELLQVQPAALGADLIDLQKAARISFGPRAAALFAEETAPPDSEALTFPVDPTPAPTIEPATDTPATTEKAGSEITETVTTEMESPPPAPPVVEMRGTAPGLLAPDFSLPLLPAEPSAVPTQTVSFADMPGAPTLLSFWTTWCPYCRQQTPLLVDAYQRYAGDGLRFLGIDVKEDASLVHTYVQNAQIPYPIALDFDGAVAEEFMVRGFPTTYFLDAEGRVVARHVGQLTSELIDDYLSRLLTSTSEENRSE